VYRGTAQGGWQPVTCNGRNGWISATYVRTNPAATVTPTRTPTRTPTGTPGPQTGTGTVAGTGGLGVNCRSGAGTSFAVITTLRDGQTVPVRGVMQNGWQPVTCAGRPGFVLGDYLRVSAGATPTPTVPVTRTPVSSPPPSPTTVPAGQAIVQGTDDAGVNCRTGAGTGFSVIAVVSEGTRVTVRGSAQAGWVPVRCGGRDGWISGQYLRLLTATLPTSTMPERSSGMQARKQRGWGYR
jgi:D-alanyl-D-alanine carboxypeptidase